MSSKLEPAIWSRYTAQRIPCFDRCQFTITWMSNIKEGDYKLEYDRHVAQCRRRWAHAPAIHAASHVGHGKRIAWFSISMHACGSVPIVMVLHLAAAGAPLLFIYFQTLNFN